MMNFNKSIREVSVGLSVKRGNDHICIIMNKSPLHTNQFELSQNCTATLTFTYSQQAKVTNHIIKHICKMATLPLSPPFITAESPRPI